MPLLQKLTKELDRIITETRGESSGRIVNQRVRELLEASLRKEGQG